MYFYLIKINLCDIIEGNKKSELARLQPTKVLSLANGS